MKIIDLTMPIDERTPVFPGDPNQSIEQYATIEKNGWNEKRLTFNSHFGTHIDAPFHMLQDGKKLDDFPIEHFIGKAIVIDAGKKNDKNEIIVRLEEVQEDDIVFFYTGNTEKAYSDLFFKNNPVISLATARELAERKVKIVGLDSYTPDNAPYETHKLLFRHGICIVENLVNLKQLVGKRFTCQVMPLKIAEADGAPCRVVATLK